MSPGSGPCGSGRWTDRTLCPVPAPGSTSIQGGDDQPVRHHTFSHRLILSSFIVTRLAPTPLRPEVPRPVGRSPVSGVAGLPPHAPGVRHRAGSLDITARAGGGGSAPDGSAARARGVRLSERAPRRCCRQVWADLGRLRLCPGWCRRLGVGLEDPMEDVADLVLPDGLGQDEDRALRPAMQLGQIVGGGRDGG